MGQRTYLAAHEVAALAQAGRCGIDAPEVIGFEIDNVGFGKPVVLMSLSPGGIELQPRDVQKYCGQLARTLAQIQRRAFLRISGFRI